MRTRPYSEVDVFSEEPYRGNALAVVHDAGGLGDEEMQRFAAWTNLSETTFLLPPSSPEADYRVRIFTGSEELPFAGHPTLGSARAWLDAGGSPRANGTVMQECAAGLVPVRVEGESLAFEAPPITRYGPVDEPLLRRLAEVLGIRRVEILDASWLVNGPQWIGVRLASAREVLDLQPDPTKAGDLEIGVVGPYDAAGDAAYEVRAFVGGDPVWEDPVTGSLNAGLGQWLTDTAMATPPYTVSQGTVLGRRGRVRISRRDGKIWVGGTVTSCIEGTVRL
ncbi:PhzF family phenazine biosynthesis isomerase [Arthrobacter yangruifuii]|uniref:PhzF family phenazine biosynthesis isomerase n=1 Tax=Arthrobacter yangruifuii TaxID=2606616 RepID=A0A5N6MEP9_9MICC|nr:PhzF family phenazine biosynthesis protein [Arthrobacter yangruifuii]KAD3455986.1 PhzF family phenazine biosynthesis isomerase [Arthrobacter yangruifuii]